MTYRFEREELTSYLGATPVVHWFNRRAPRIKSGEIVPERLDREQAIDLLLDDPSLIHRPLLDLGGVRVVGFDLDFLETMGLFEPPQLASLADADLEACPRDPSVCPH